MLDKFLPSVSFPALYLAIKVDGSIKLGFSDDRATSECTHASQHTAPHAQLTSLRRPTQLYSYCCSYSALLNTPTPSYNNVDSGERGIPHARLSDVQPGGQAPHVSKFSPYADPTCICPVSTNYSKLLGFAYWKPSPVGTP